MEELDTLTTRLAAALQRVERAAMDLSEAPAKPDGPTEAEMQALRGQLEDERTTNAQLIERVRAIKEKQETQVAQLEASLKASSEAEAERAALQQRLRATIEDLRGQLARQTEANRAMVGDADLVNMSMMVELEALRAARDADAAEVDEMIAELGPLIQEAQGA